MAGLEYDILKDDLSGFAGRGAAFVTFGEVMVRDTPADMERPERARLVHLSMAGSEYTLAIALQRLGVPSRLLYFPDENHWVLKPLNSIQWHEVVLDWMDTWTAPAEEE